MSIWLRLRPFFSVSIRYLRISYLELKSEYQGTRLGLAWVPLSTIIFTSMLALVFHHSEAGHHVEFFLYVLSGYVLWNFISESISGSVDIIQKRLDFAIHNNMSLIGLFLKILSDRFFIYAINIVLLIVCIAVLDQKLFGLHNLLIFPFLFVVLSTSLSVSFLVNVVTIYLPDMSTLIRTGVRFVFFASPVFWINASGDGVRGLLVTYNPAAYFLSLSRQVFGIEPVSTDKWIVVLVLTAVTAVAALWAYRGSQGLVRNLK